MNLQRLIELLYLLASTADVQIRAFPEFVHVPDEIAMETSDAIGSVSETKDEKNKDALAALHRIDALLQEMGGDVENWTLESLKNSKKWDIIRDAARKEINELGIKCRIPNLFWLTYFANPSQ